MSLTDDRFWPVCDPPEPPRKVGYQGRSGPVLLTQSLAGVDPKQTKRVCAARAARDLRLRHRETLYRESQSKIGELRESCWGELVAEISISKECNNNTRLSPGRSDIREEFLVSLQSFNEADHLCGKVLRCDGVSNAVSPSRVSIVPGEKPLRCLSSIAHAMRKVRLQSQDSAYLAGVQCWMDNE
jgi:hypothetical protein